jgi:endonuclease/exonuclease/phosphatase family metal-dependent hydrolase
MVLGVCMPWRRDAPPLPEGAASSAEGGPAQWRTVLARLDAALERLAPSVPSRRLLLAGDLNQTLSGRNVGFTGGRQRLEELLSRHRLVAYTAEQPSKLPGCSSVDHICGPTLRHRLDHWPAAAEHLSDHRGCVLALG